MVHNSCLEMTGFERESVIGKNFFDLKTWADVEQIKKLISELSEKNILSLETEIKISKNHKIPIKLTLISKNTFNDSYLICY